MQDGHKIYTGSGKEGPTSSVGGGNVLSCTEVLVVGVTSEVGLCSVAFRTLGKALNC